MNDRIHDILQQYWGYISFRPGQEAVIQSVLSGKDTLALLPTGAGKSICYQVPALVSEGMTIVISPLIALMKDQVDHLKGRGIKAEAIYSSMPYHQIDRILDNAIFGDVKLLYLSPERLTTDLAEARVRQMKVSLIAVDEAHCISQWGYDFRPAYLQIAAIRSWLEGVPVIALTATAIPAVAKDIQEKLLFRHPNCFQTSFRRDNLSFSVHLTDAKFVVMAQLLKNLQGTVIVYVRSRRKTEEYAQYLTSRGIPALAYHAGMNAEERMNRQDQWQSGQVPVMVATNAFGMGIDKSDVRKVVHIGLPESLEAYYQEAGRAGRDGKPADAILITNDTDIAQLVARFDASFPPLEVVKKVYRAIGSYLQIPFGSGQYVSYDFDVSDFCQKFHFDTTICLSALKILEENEWISFSESVFSPASIMVTATREDLYQHQMGNDLIHRVVTALLRTFQGIHQFAVSIRESQFARSLEISTADLIKQLKYLDNLGLIEYTPKKDKPQLTFLQSRTDADYLTFDQQMLSFRKKRRRAYLDAIIEYVHTSHCRQVKIMQYFGETDAAPCGQCDRCKASLHSDGIVIQKSRLRVELHDLLMLEKTLSVSQLKSIYPIDKHELIGALIQEWLDEGEIIIENDRIRMPV